MSHDPLSKFWMVWCTSRGGPMHKHYSKGDARAEAERLSQQHPGFPFIVLAAVDAVISPIMDPQTLKLTKGSPREADDDIPF